MNSLLNRSIQRSKILNKNILFKSIKQHYQMGLLRQPQHIPIFIIMPETKPKPIIRKPIIEPIIEKTLLVKRKLTIPGPPPNEFDFLNEIELKSVRRMNIIFDERKLNPPPMKKPIMTPNGIRVGKLTIPGPPPNEFDFLKELEMKSIRSMNIIFDERKRNPPMKKPIMTPNGIRVGKLTIPGPPPNEFLNF